MTASPLDSALYRGLFTDAEAARLFTDTAELRAILLCWGALARAQSAHQLIPETAAEAIQRAAMEHQIDPSALTSSVARDGVPIPALVEAFRNEMKAPEHAAFVHFGATSQDLLDTALSLRLRQALTLLDTGLRQVLDTLARIADSHATQPMAARTWGQVATPTSFGAIAASWGAPLLTLVQELPTLRQSALLVSLAGAAGTGSALGPQAASIRAAFAKGLGLPDPGCNWHSDRTPRLILAGWLTRLAQALGRFGADIALMNSSGRGEVRIETAGHSSTMPHKQNPVQAQVLRALATQAAALNAALQAAGQHTEQRDGGAWMVEWLALPQLVIGTAGGLLQAKEMAQSLRAVPAAMAEGLQIGGGTVLSESLMFALAAHMPRPKAQAEVKAMCQAMVQSGETLQQVAAARFPDLDLAQSFEPNLGTAPDEARAFAASVAALPSAT